MVSMRPVAYLLFLLVPGVTARLAVNELVARPASGEGEWIEIANPGPDPVVLDGWGVRDGTGTLRHIADNARVEPGGFAVLAARPESVAARFAVPPGIPVLRPGGWPVLNDRDAGAGLPADVIVLERPDGSVADSVAYFESWLPPREGRSLERVSPGRSGLDAGAWGWSLDPAGATPGRPNSLASAENPDPAVWTGPSHVRPGGEPATFDYRVPRPGTLAVRLLDDRGREVATLQAPREAAAVGRWVWGAGVPRPRRSGLYFVCMRWQHPGLPPVRRCLAVWVTV